MIKVLEIYLKAEGTRPFLVLISLLLAALCEAIGIGTLVPALAVLSGQENGAASSFGQSLTKAFSVIGVTPTLGSLLIVIVAAFTLKSAISFGALTYAGISASRVSVLLRQRLINALFNASWSFYSSQQGGNFANAISGDATRAGEAYLMAAQFAAMVVQAAVYAVVALLIDWRLALIGFVVGGIMAQVLSFLIRVSRRAGASRLNAPGNSRSKWSTCWPTSSR